MTNYIISAYKTGFSKESNQERHDHLLNVLLPVANIPYTYVEVEGCYKGTKEQSLLITCDNIFLHDLLALGSLLGQETILEILPSGYASLVYVEPHKGMKGITKVGLGKFVPVSKEYALSQDAYTIYNGEYYTTI